MSSWVRLWRDMPTDPKWRVVAKRSGRPLPEIISIFVFMLANAGANATERGVLENWSHDDIAAALDMETEHVKSIYDAMQGKTLEGDKLTGWEKRQPKREDGAAERAKEWRERKRTQTNAPKRPDTDSDADSETEEKRPVSSESGTVRANGQEHAGLNGSTEEIVSGIAFFLNNLAPDRETAKRIVVSNCGLYGPDAVRDGYAELMADVADNKVRVPSVKALVGYFKTAKNRTDTRPRPHANGAPQKRSVMDVIRETAARETVQ